MEEEEIKKLEKEIKRLQKLVYYDELTGILNRRGFKEEAERVFQTNAFFGKRKEKRYQIPFSIIFIDIDNFKKVNDTYGHDEGDKVLKHTAKILGESLRKNDIFARWGGEEFVVALYGADKNTSVKVAEKICNRCADTEVHIGNERKKVTMSVGIVSHYDEDNIHQMIEKADQAMYEAKEKGKNQVVVFLRGKQKTSYFMDLLHLVKGTAPKEEKIIEKKSVNIDGIKLKTVEVK